MNNKSFIKKCVIFIFCIFVLIFISLIEEGKEMRETNKKIVGYYTMESVDWEGYYPKDIPWDCLTHCLYSFYVPQEDGNLLPSDPISNAVCLDDPENSIITYAHNNDVKIVLSIGGGAGSDNFSVMCNNLTYRTNFVNNVKLIIEQYSFDGIDIDWEYPVLYGIAEDAANFVILMNELRAMLDEFSDYKTLSMALNNSEWAGQYYLTEEMNCDWFSVMSYDVCGSWDTITYHNAPMNSYSGDWRINTQYSMDYWSKTRGLPKNKLLVGLPFYGHSFANATDPLSSHTGWGIFGDGEGSARYRDIVEAIENNNFVEHWDSTCLVPWGTVTSLGEYVTYDNERSIGIKLDYTIDREFGGVLIWNVEYDNLSDGTQPLCELVRTKLLVAETPLIKKIELKLIELINTINKANNYSLNWAPCNIEDRALESLYSDQNFNCYPVLYFMGEDSLQTNKDNFADKYENKIRYQLQVRYVTQKEFADPRFTAAMFNQKAIEDFKQLLAKKNSLDLNFVQKAIYKNSKTLNDNNIINVGDRFCPIYSEINFEVFYNQSRSNVFKGAC